MLMKTAGQVAYEAWTERLRARMWNDLSSRTQQRWEETAQAAIRQAKLIAEAEQATS